MMPYFWKELYNLFRLFPFKLPSLFLFVGFLGFAASRLF